MAKDLPDSPSYQAIAADGILNTGAVEAFGQDTLNAQQAAFKISNDAIQSISQVNAQRRAAMEQAQLLKKDADAKDMLDSLAEQLKGIPNDSGVIPTDKYATKTGLQAATSYEDKTDAEIDTLRSAISDPILLSEFDARIAAYKSQKDLEIAANSISEQDNFIFDAANRAGNRAIKEGSLDSEPLSTHAESFSTQLRGLVETGGMSGEEADLRTKQVLQSISDKRLEKLAKTNPEQAAAILKTQGSLLLSSPETKRINKKVTEAQLKKIEEAKKAQAIQSDISHRISFGASLADVDAEDLNNHFLAMQQQQQAIVGDPSPMSLMNKADLASTYNAPIEAFNKEMGFFITGGNADEVVEAITAYKYLQDTNPGAMNGLKKEERVLAEMTIDVMGKTGISPLRAYERVKAALELPDEKAAADRESEWFNGISQSTTLKTGTAALGQPVTSTTTARKSREDMIDAVIAKFGGNPAATDGKIRNSIESVLKQAFIQTGKPAEAVTMAYADLKANFGVSELSGGQLIDRPPEKVYPGINKDTFKALIMSDITQSGQYDLATIDQIRKTLTLSTPSATKPGEPAYTINYTDEDGQVQSVLNGAAWQVPGEYLTQVDMTADLADDYDNQAYLARLKSDGARRLALIDQKIADVNAGKLSPEELDASILAGTGVDGGPTQSEIDAMNMQADTQNFLREQAASLDKANQFAIATYGNSFETGVITPAQAAARQDLVMAKRWKEGLNNLIKADATQEQIDEYLATDIYGKTKDMYNNEMSWRGHGTDILQRDDSIIANTANALLQQVETETNGGTDTSVTDLSPSSDLSWFAPGDPERQQRLADYKQQVSTLLASGAKREDVAKFLTQQIYLEESPVRAARDVVFDRQTKSEVFDNSIYLKNPESFTNMSYGPEGQAIYEDPDIMPPVFGEETIEKLEAPNTIGRALLASRGGDLEAIKQAFSGRKEVTDPRAKWAVSDFSQLSNDSNVMAKQLLATARLAFPDNDSVAQAAAAFALLQLGRKGGSKKSGLAMKANNLFGIMANLEAGTAGFVDGQATILTPNERRLRKVRYKKNLTAADSFRDFRKLLMRNPNLRKIMNANNFAQAAALMQKAGLYPDMDLTKKLTNMHNLLLRTAVREIDSNRE